MNTYKSADDPDQPGDSEIPAAVWDQGYDPPSPYIANTTRNLQFNQSHFIASPDAPDGTTTYVTTSDGYSWASMSKAVNAMWPYSAADYSGLSRVNAYYAGNLVVTPADGVVKVTANFKAQDMKFWAAEDGLPADDEMAELLTRHFVTDQWGNEYVMHASGETGAAEVAQAFEDAVLPAGWTKSSRTLTEDLILNPAEGADGSYHYLVFRDSADNTYHQISWSGRGALAAQVDGMPVWGGQDGDVLTGDADGVRADSIHGAGGGDVLAGWDGADTLWGDAGADTVSGGGGADLLYGNPGADLLNGGADADTLYGGQEADLLEGGAGDDVLYGGLGDDTLSGGPEPTR
jgi:Ca2+-binding RTX toxin-like protein